MAKNSFVAELTFNDVRDLEVCGFIQNTEI